jgi:PKHD-type hydroxylase
MNDNFQWFTHTPFLSDEQCDEIVSQLKKETNWTSGYENAIIVNADEKSLDNVIQDRTFEELYMFSNTKHDYKWINKKLEPYVKMLNTKVWNFQLKETLKDLKALRYKNNDRFDWHADYDKGEESINKLTCLIQLSDESEFEGGDLHLAFTNDGEFFKTPYKRGYLLVFPSFVSHMVSELSGGERYIIREIITGEPFK